VKVLIANYGYKDGSGEYFITLDTDKCDGCGKCVEVLKMAISWVFGKSTDINSNIVVLRVNQLAGMLNPLVLLLVLLVLLLIS
jgi:hypothetical protein